MSELEDDRPLLFFLHGIGISLVGRRIWPGNKSVGTLVIDEVVRGPEGCVEAKTGQGPIFLGCNYPQHEKLHSHIERSWQPRIVMAKDA